MQEPSYKSEIQSLKDFLDLSSERSLVARALRATTTSFWESAHGRLCGSSGAIPESGLTPGKNYILLHQACIDRVNSRVTQKGNL